MDFLDPKLERRNRLTLFVGYALITLAIGIGTLVLLYQAYGFGVTSKGQVTQSGLVFASSQPTGANIYLNGKLYKSQTDTRMVLESGTYGLTVAANGYRDWKHQVVVAGGDVQHYDYPFLFPKTLQTKTTATLPTIPAFSSQSPDRRWVLMKAADATADFSLYDLKNPATPVATALSIPAALYTAGDGAQSWVVVEWSSDNHRVLLRHEYTVAGVASHEYVMFDRASVDASVNVTRTLQIAPGEELTLFNKKYNQYYGFDKATGTLRTLSLDNSLEAQTLEHIVAFKSFGGDTLLYATSQPPTGKAVEGKVSVVLQQGQKTYTLRTLPAAAPLYDLDIAQYSGDWYAVVGASNDKGVYIYKNPQTPTTAVMSALPTPWRFMALAEPTHVSFSASAQYIMVESGQQFVVYDAENVRTIRFAALQPLDAPQQYATWMDGDRLTYVSGGKQVVFDYDYQNAQTLQAALPSFVPSFDPSYKYVFTLAPHATDAAQALLTDTSLLVTK